MVATFIGNGLQSASVGRLWSYVNSELNRKAVVENCLKQRAILVSSQKKKNNLLERHRWQFLTSDPRFKEYMACSVKEITNTCGNKHQKERESIHLQ